MATYTLSEVLPAYYEGAIECACSSTGGGGSSSGTVSAPSLSSAFPTATAASEFGTDIDVISELPTGFTLAGGIQNLANALLRRLSTPERFLADNFGDDPDYGWDCRRLLNRALTDAELRGELRKAEGQALLDDRVQSVTARYAITGAAPQQTVTLELDVVTAEGPFRLMVLVDEVSPALLAVDPLAS